MPSGYAARPARLVGLLTRELPFKSLPQQLAKVCIEQMRQTVPRKAI